VRTFERNRSRIIDHIAARIGLLTDARAIKWLRAYCRLTGIPATESDLNEMAQEAVRRRLMDEIRQLKENQVTMRDAFLALKAKVDQYHP